MSDVTLSMEQLQEVIQSAVAAALAAQPKRGRPAKAKAAPSAEQTEKEQRKAAYLIQKQETAIRLMKEKGVHYTVFQKGRKLYIWSDLTVDKTRRSGRSVTESLGSRVWSTSDEYSLSGEKRAA